MRGRQCGHHVDRDWIPLLLAVRKPCPDLKQSEGYREERATTEKWSQEGIPPTKSRYQVIEKY
jgi:hypothetical protein